MNKVCYYSPNHMNNLITVYDYSKNKIITLTKEELGFSYRHSILKEKNIIKQIIIKGEINIKIKRKCTITILNYLIISG